MADPLSVAAGVLAIVTAAINSAKFLYNLVDGINAGPEDVRETLADVKDLEQILRSIAAEFDPQLLERIEVSSSFARRMPEMELIVRDCHSSLDDFRRYLETSRGHSVVNRTRLYFQRKETKRHAHTVRRYKETLTLASLEVSTFWARSSAQSSAENGRAILRLEEMTERNMQFLTGHLQGLALVGQLAADLEADHQDAMLAVVQGEENKASRCLKFCLPILDAATQETGHRVKYAEAFDEANQLFGNIGDATGGGPAVIVDRMVGRDKSRQIVGNFDHRAFEAFLSR